MSWFSAQFNASSNTPLTSFAADPGISWVLVKGSTSPLVFSAAGGIVANGGAGTVLARANVVSSQPGASISAPLHFDSVNGLGSTGVGYVNAAGTAGYVVLLDATKKLKVYRVGSDPALLALVVDSGLAIGLGSGDHVDIIFTITVAPGAVTLNLTRDGGTPVITDFQDTDAARFVDAGYPALWFDNTQPAGSGIWVDSLAVDAVAGPADTTAPTLTSPTGASTGTATASGSVTTDEGNGTLYSLATTNATETVATVKASGATQAISSTGAKTVTASGLTPATPYYLHYVHRDAAGNDSVRVSSASFTTATAGDTTPPVLASPTATAATSTTASGSVTTNEANGALYRYASTNATESAATVTAAAVFSAVTATGAQSASFTGLTPGATYYAHYVHRDAAGNNSLVSNSASFTTPSALTRTITIKLVDLLGAGIANLTGLKYAVFAEATPDLFGAPIAQGASETTDGAGSEVISFASSLASGSTVWLDVTNSTGNAATIHKAFSGPVVIA